jgi:hypothetical protein
MLTMLDEYTRQCLAIRVGKKPKSGAPKRLDDAQICVQ